MTGSKAPSETAAKQGPAGGDRRGELTEVLRTLIDPEVGLNVVDLGLLRSLEVTGSLVRLEMTLTHPGCPIGGSLEDAARDLLLGLGWVDHVELKLSFDPPWSRDDITREGRKLLGLE